MSQKKKSSRATSGSSPRRHKVDTVSGASGLIRNALEQSRPDIGSTLSHAEVLNNTGRAQELVPLLTPIEIYYPFELTAYAGQFDRLLGYGYAHEKRWAEAERCLERGHQLFPTALDFLYGLTYVRLSLREYQSALESAEQYSQIVADNDKSSLAARPFNTALAQQAHLFNYLGLCHQELGENGKAEISFRKAIDLDPIGHHQYLNLANFYLRLGERTRASEIIQAGIQRCPQVHELRMLAAGLDHKASVSACLIVKNEEELLPACLESIRNWVDEIIVVDTGSTDRTMEIARSFGAKVYEHPWEGSFSKARNFSLQYATKDWLFIIDADERVYAEDIPQILTAVNQQDADVITTNVYNVYEEFKDVVVFLPSHRFFRRELNVRYEGIVHNQLCISDTARYLRSGVRIKHLGYGLSREKMKAKTIRTKTLLEKQLAENPDNAFALFNYAQLLRSTPDGFHKEYAPLILKSAGRAVELTQPDNSTNRHIHLMCLDQLAWTNYYLGNYEQALTFSQRALDIKSDYLDPILLRGYLYFKLNDLPRATFYFEKYLKTQAGYDPSKEMENIILVHLNARTDAYFNLGAMAEIQGEIEIAKRYYREALLINEDYVAANLNLGRILLNEGHVSDAERCLQKVVESGEATPEICVKLSQLFSERGEAQQAETILRRGIKLSPENVPLLEAMADLYAATGRYDDAATTLANAWQANSSSRELAIKLSNALVQTGRVPQAIDVFLTYARQNALTAEMQNDLGNCYYRLQDFSKAEQSYRQAVELSPRLNLAKRNLGLALAMQHKSDEAIDVLTQCLEADPEQGELFHVIADLFVSNRSFSEALGNYEKYLQRYPTDVAALCRLSDCYLQLGHKDSAILGYQRVLQLDPGFPAAKYRLAEISQTTKSGEMSTPKGKV